MIYPINVSDMVDLVTKETYDVNFFYLKEIKKLIVGLAERGIDFTFLQIYDGFQVDVPSQAWDAICHSGSYGNKEGLLEVMGSIVRNNEDTVEGFLTAQEILNRLDETKGE